MVRRFRACRRLLVLGLLPVAAAVSCGETVDFKQSLRITETSGGWYDFGIVDGKNKLVPTMSFRIQKPADVRLRSVDINVHFKKISAEARDSKEAEEELAEVFLQNVEFGEGNQTALLTVRPDNGYTAEPPQTRAEMLAHSQFRDVRARVFAKQTSTTWVELIAYEIPRVLVTK
jgi:hypothetical protein